jgi:hypothetical protein
MEKANYSSLCGRIAFAGADSLMLVALVFDILQYEFLRTRHPLSYTPHQQPTRRTHISASIPPSPVSLLPLLPPLPNSPSAAAPALPPSRRRSWSSRAPSSAAAKPPSSRVKRLEACWFPCRHSRLDPAAPFLFSVLGDVVHGGQGGGAACPPLGGVRGGPAHRGGGPLLRLRPQIH